MEKRRPGRPVKSASVQGPGVVVQDFLKAIYYLQQGPVGPSASPFATAPNPPSVTPSASSPSATAPNPPSAEPQSFTQNRWVSVSELAERLELAASTVSVQVQKLAADGYVNYRPYKGASLTPTGLSEALRVIRKHRLIECLLVSELGYTWDEVHAEAEVLEHAVSDLFVDRVEKVLGYPQVDPHGDPIPNARGEVRTPIGQTLVSLPLATPAQVLRVSDENPDFLRYLQQVGVTPGTQIQLVHVNEAAGLLCLECAGEHINLALGAGRNILVRPL